MPNTWKNTASGLVDTKMGTLPLLLDINLNGLDLGLGSQGFSLSLEKKKKKSHKSQRW